MPPSIHEPIIGLPDFKIISYRGSKTVEIEAEYIGKHECPHCHGLRLRKTDSFLWVFKHHSIGINKSVLIMRTFKFQCYECKRYFNQRFQGINLYQRVTEPFKEQVGLRHHHGTSKRVTATDLDPEGRKSRGLISMMRRHEWSKFKPRSKERLIDYLNNNLALKVIYEFKQDLMKLILSRVSNRKQAEPLVAEYLKKIEQLQESNIAPLATLGKTLENWQKKSLECGALVKQIQLQRVYIDAWMRY